MADSQRGDKQQFERVGSLLHEAQAFIASATTYARRVWLQDNPLRIRIFEIHDELAELRTMLDADFAKRYDQPPGAFRNATQYLSTPPAVAELGDTFTADGHLADEGGNDSAPVEVSPSSVTDRPS